MIDRKNIVITSDILLEIHKEKSRLAGELAQLVDSLIYAEALDKFEGLRGLLRKYSKWSSRGLAPVENVNERIEAIRDEILYLESIEKSINDRYWF